jgi:hypothetical protein
MLERRPSRPPGPSSALLQQLRYLQDPFGIFRTIERAVTAHAPDRHMRARGLPARS